ncbi:MAG: SMI1/KNR4 family protein [Eubacteriaceae bacterium]
MITFKYIKPLRDVACITDFEKEFECKFDKDFINCIKINNGGRPSVKVFDTSNTAERTIKKLLSFNKDDDENIWKANTFLKNINEALIAFAMDSFGNYICFQKDENNIVFFEQETETIEKVADNFDGFLKKLR